MEEKLYLVLGCFGLRDDNFVSCRGIENRILEIDVHLAHYEEIMDYFESVRLFDKPMFDLNAIRHVIHYLQDRFDQNVKRLWTEKYYHLLEKFVVAHRFCGIYIKLALINTEYNEDDYDENVKEFEETFIKAESQLIKTPNLKLVRGRR